MLNAQPCGSDVAAPEPRRRRDLLSAPRLRPEL